MFGVAGTSEGAGAAVSALHGAGTSMNLRFAEAAVSAGASLNPARQTERASSARSAWKAKDRRVFLIQAALVKRGGSVATSGPPR
jgi:hypothetical protein